MITKMHFQNFKALKNCDLSLGPFNLLVGPNGSGKSTVLQLLDMMQMLGRDLQDHERQGWQPPPYEHIASISRVPIPNPASRVVASISTGGGNHDLDSIWRPAHFDSVWRDPSRGNGQVSNPHTFGEKSDFLRRVRCYSFDHEAISRPTPLVAKPDIKVDGEGLAAVLDRLHGAYPETFDALCRDLSQCLPEFDRILLPVPENGKKGIELRMAGTSTGIPAKELSGGTLLVLALLTLARLPEPPAVIGLEEPDHGIHPRLLRDVRDALYRLSFPGDYGETRPPVQVIATTHSPYFLDLFKDHPEQIVIASKSDAGVQFMKLSEMPQFEEIMGGAPLGDVWYSGVLGGVPLNT